MTIQEWLDNNNWNLKEGAKTLGVPLKLFTSYYLNKTPIPEEIVKKISEKNNVEKELALESPTIENVLENLRQFHDSIFWPVQQTVVDYHDTDDEYTLLKRYLDTSDIIGMVKVFKKVQYSFTANITSPYTKIENECFPIFTVVDIVQNDDEIDQEKIRLLSYHDIPYAYGKNAQNILKKLNSIFTKR